MSFINSTNDDLGLDFLNHDFIFLDDDKGSDDRINVDEFLESDSPVFGSDPILASALNQDDDYLAYVPTDVWQQIRQNEESGKKQSPWHESDSGVSDATLSVTSPLSSIQEEDSSTVKLSYTTSLSQKSQKMDVLDINVKDLDVEVDDIYFLDQLSPSSSNSHSPHISKCQISKTDAEKSNIDYQFETAEDDQRQALEFFSSSELFPIPPKSENVKFIHAWDPKDEHMTMNQCIEDKSKKNAIQAKINREKKKAYIKSLEDEIQSLKTENRKLKSENSKMHNTTSDLEEEVAYLKSVLVNSSSLSNVLKNISGVNEVKLSATIVSRKRASDDHSYNIVESSPEKRARRINENLKKAGVCLHVNGDSACLEFCAHCSKLAQKSSSSSRCESSPACTGQKCLVFGVAVGLEPEIFVFIRVLLIGPLGQRTLW